MILGPKRATIPATSIGRSDRGKIGSCAVAPFGAVSKSVDRGNDGIEGLWRLNPKLGIDRCRITADQQSMSKSIGDAGVCLARRSHRVDARHRALFPQEASELVDGVGDGPCPIGRGMIGRPDRWGKVTQGDASWVELAPWQWVRSAARSNRKLRRSGAVGADSVFEVATWQPSVNFR
jgi:hypothetical protein